MGRCSRKWQSIFFVPTSSTWVIMNLSILCLLKIWKKLFTFEKSSSYVYMLMTMNVIAFSRLFPLCHQWLVGTWVFQHQVYHLLKALVNLVMIQLYPITSKWYIMTKKGKRVHFQTKTVRIMHTCHGVF